MIYHRCKCGTQEAWESGFPPRPCDVCSKCGSTLSWSPHHHEEPQPHEWEEKWVIRAGEPVKIKQCIRCYKEE